MRWYDLVTKKQIKKVLPVIGIIIFIYLIISIGIEKIINVFATVQPVYLLLSFFLIIPYMLLQTYKWQYILHNNNKFVELYFWYLLKVNFIGQFYGVLTPGRLGTLMRIQYLKDKTNKTYGECSPSVIIDKVIDLFALFVLAIVGMVLLIEQVSNFFFITILALFVIFASTYAFFTKKELSARVLRVIYATVVPAKLKEGAQQTFESFYDNLPKIRELYIPFFLAIFSWILMYSANYFVALSVGMQIPYFNFITLFPVATLVGLIPITISGWGTREATLILLLSQFNVAPEEVIAMSLLAFMVNSVIIAAIGAILAFGRGDEGVRV